MKNFFDTKDEKITEKAFSQSLIISVVCILLCLAALCSMTYAWFSSDVSSSSNRLESGHFDLNITVTKNSGEGEIATAEAIEVTEVEGREGIWSCTLSQAGTYTVELKMTELSTVKGHCIVTVENDTPKKTDVIIGVNTENSGNRTPTDPFVFKITVTNETAITFEPVWGEVVEPDIKHEEVITVGALQTENEETAIDLNEFIGASKSENGY